MLQTAFGPQTRSGYSKFCRAQVSDAKKGDEILVYFPISLHIV